MRNWVLGHYWRYLRLFQRRGIQRYYGIQKLRLIGVTFINCTLAVCSFQFFFSFLLFFFCSLLIYEIIYILTWLKRCWNAGLLCVLIVLLSRSAFSAYSVKAFHGGWYAVTSKPCRFNGESCRTGELATIGIPCIAPYPNFRPSCNKN